MTSIRSKDKSEWVLDLRIVETNANALEIVISNKEGENKITLYNVDLDSLKEFATNLLCECKRLKL